MYYTLIDGHNSMARTSPHTQPGLINNLKSQSNNNLHNMSIYSSVARESPHIQLKYS